MIDFLLTTNGDLFLEEALDTSNPIRLNFHIAPNSHAICLKFDLVENFAPITYSGINMQFKIKPQQVVYQSLVTDTEEQLLKQLCYNAIRTQKNSLSDDAGYGSYFYQYKNKQLTPARLKELEKMAQTTIAKDFPDVQVTATSEVTTNGAAIILFTIEIQEYTFTLDYYI